MDWNYKNLLIEQPGQGGRGQGVWTMVINRPTALNALNSELLNEMADFFRQIGEMKYDNARALVITGTGEKAFVAGADIKEMSGLSEEEAQQFAIRGQSVFQELSLLKIPVVAAVNGFALGGGCELALACDFIYANEKASFGLPEVSLGLIPGFGGTARLARAVGLRRAKEMTFTGSRIGAAEALQMGLVNKVCTSADLLNDVYKVLESVLNKGPVAVGVAKLAINQNWDMEIEEAQRNEAVLFGELFATHDVREGTAAFIEKRKADFKGE